MSIVENRKARFNYHIEERFEAGVVLSGWEIKAIRAGHVQLTDGYVVIKDGELYLIGCRINALRSPSTPSASRLANASTALIGSGSFRNIIIGRLSEHVRHSARRCLSPQRGW